MTSCASDQNQLFEHVRYCGWLQKRSQYRKQWNKRHVRVTVDGHLQTFESESQDALKTDDIELMGSSTSLANFSRAPSTFGFRIDAKQKTLRFTAETDAEREVWMNTLLNAVDEQIRLANDQCATAGLDVQEQSLDSRSKLVDSEANSIIIANGSEDVSPRLASPQSLEATRLSTISQPVELASSGEKSPEKEVGKGKGKREGKGKSGGKGPPPPPAFRVPPPSKEAKQKATDLPLGVRLTVAPLPRDAHAEAFMSNVPSLPSASTGAGNSDEAPIPTVDTSKIRFDALLETFKAKEALAKRKNSKQEPSSKRTEILPKDVAQNVLIVLRALSVDTSALANSLEVLEPETCALSAEECERIIQVLPKCEDLRKLAYCDTEEGSSGELRDAEQRLLPIAKLTRLPERLRILMTAKTHKDLLSNALTNMSSLQRACSAVRNSKFFYDLLQIILAVVTWAASGVKPSESETLTPRTSEETRRAIDVRSLLRLKDTKAHGRGSTQYHLLHWCLDELLLQRPDLSVEVVEQELGPLRKADCATLAQLTCSLDRFREDRNFVYNELHRHGEDYKDPTVFENTPEPLPAEPEPEKPEEPCESQFEAYSVGSRDTDSEEDEKEESRPPGPIRRRSIFQRIKDAARVAEAILSGEVVFGKADRRNHRGEPEIASDGEPPPPGILHMLSSAGKWRRCWCEVRAHMLVLGVVKMVFGKPECIGAFYVALPGAEILPLNSLLASERAQNLASSGVSGLEIIRSSARPIVLSAPTTAQANRWIDFLTLQSTHKGLGFMDLHLRGWRLVRSSWKRLLCFLDVPPADATECEPRLLGFETISDYALQKSPSMVWPLGEISARSLGDDAASKKAKKLLEFVPNGVEIEDYETGNCWQFRCSSWEDQQHWVEALRNAIPVSSTVVSADQVGLSDKPWELQIDTGNLFDLFQFIADVEPKRTEASHDVEHSREPINDEAGAAQVTPPVSPLGSYCDEIDMDRTEAKRDELDMDGTEGTESKQSAIIVEESFFEEPALRDVEEALSPASQRRDALSQLQQLEAELRHDLEEWESSLAATEANCRGLLKFFGLPAPSDSSISNESEHLLNSLNTFRGEIAKAWRELQTKHRHVRQNTAARRPSRAKTNPRRVTVDEFVDANAEAESDPEVKSSSQQRVVRCGLSEAIDNEAKFFGLESPKNSPRSVDFDTPPSEEHADEANVDVEGHNEYELNIVPVETMDESLHGRAIESTTEGANFELFISTLCVGHDGAGLDLAAENCGMRVQAVLPYPGQPGLQPKDLITEINEVPLIGSHDAVEEIFGANFNDGAKIQVKRPSA